MEQNLRCPRSRFLLFFDFGFDPVLRSLGERTKSAQKERTKGSGVNGTSMRRDRRRKSLFFGRRIDVSPYFSSALALVEVPFTPDPFVPPLCSPLTSSARGRR